MKIVYLLPGGLFNSGGMERVITTKANYLTDVFSYEVFIVTTEQMGRSPYFPISDKVRLCHLDIHIGKYFGKENYIQKLIRRFFKIKEYKKRVSELLEEIHPDITITTLGGLDIEFINDLKDESVKIGELHFPGTFRRMQTRKMYSSLFTNMVGEIITAGFIKKCKKLKRLVVLTEEEKTYWKEPNQLEVIPNPLPFETQRFSTTKNKKAIAAGRLAYEKGFDLLINAWEKVTKKHPDWELTIYGNGSEKDELSKLIKEKNLESVVKLHEAVKDIQMRYPDYSMLLFPTRYLDSFGMVIVEAMSCGVPAIAFNAPCGPKDLIQEGVNGFLVEAGDWEGLAESINKLIESDDLRAKMGKAAAMFSENFRIEKVMDRWVQLFEKLKK